MKEASLLELYWLESIVRGVLSFQMVIQCFDLGIPFLTHAKVPVNRSAGLGL